IVAGLSYEVLKLAAKSDNIIARIVRAPGLALQRITTKEPTEDMIEVAIAAFNLAMEGAEPCACAEEPKEETEPASEAPAEEAATEEDPAKEAE
ncbi:MAG: DUF1385 domain-containing protein, partial [Clostridia bacterium]|nr:DUF1385 domain-containing protein [Clostridia bacterium]